MKLPILTYTFLNEFNNCPHKAFHRYVLKDIPFEKTEAMEYGNEVHTAMEKRLSQGKSLSGGKHEMVLNKAHDYCNMLDKLDNINGVDIRIEWFVGMTVACTPCAWDATDVWFRGKADVAIVRGNEGWLIDWKTGNKREDPFELECQALLLHAHHPSVVRWSGEYFWFKENNPYGLRHMIDLRNVLVKIRLLHAEIDRCILRHDWPKRKNPLCDWCKVKSCENWTGKK